MTVVAQFHTAMGLDAPEQWPLQPNPDLVRFRMRLLREEFEEAMHELAQLTVPRPPEETRKVLLALLKELADLRYVLEGAAVSFGLPIDAAFTEVHRSNMSKLDANGQPIKDDGGKVLKGPNYSPADLTHLLPEIVEAT